MKKLSFLIAMLFQSHCVNALITCFLPSGKALSNSVVITPDSLPPLLRGVRGDSDSLPPLLRGVRGDSDSLPPLLRARGDSDSLDQQAQHLYETGQYQEAIPLLEQMISNYSNSGDFIGEINSLVNLALVYQTLGDLDQAKETISQSLTKLYKLDNTTEHQQLQAQILEVQGQVYLSLGQGEKALSTWQQTSAIYQDIGDLTKLT
ncbi:tetratricopeptide repeat protein [Moorena sp. SIO3I8]|uniref:tetratricopeptide repeat protein n=1 Tax=Moorena sp. SIO3I8 TaxID=2607833 RepID=UPI0025D76764|nr:tetratricopeptide repeat protein [Moorena sp. SIO3I8]